MTNTRLEINGASMIAVRFHDDEIVTFEANGEPYVAMRRICENLGLSWSTQAQRIERDDRKFNCVHIETVGADGKARTMLAMPVSKLALWLAMTCPPSLPRSL